MAKTPRPPKKNREKVVSMPDVEAPQPPEDAIQEPEADPVEDEERQPAEQQPEDPEIPANRRGRPRIGEAPAPSLRFFDRWNRDCVFPEDAEYRLFRIEPITDRVAQGKAKFLRIYNQQIDEDVIMKDPQAGSGVFQVWVKNRKSPGAPLTFAGKLERLDIENPAYPPCIEPGDWLDDPRNKRWEWARKIYEARMKEEERKNTPQPTMTVQDTIAIVEQAIDKKLGSGPKDDTVLNAIQTGINMARASAPADTTLPALLQIMQQQTAAATARAEKSQEQLMTLILQQNKPAAPPLGPEEEVQRIAKTVKALDEALPRRGSKAPDPDHPGWGILNTFVSGISPGLNTLLGVAAQKIAQAQPGQPAAAGQQRQQQPAAAQPAGQQQPAVQVQQQQPPATGGNPTVMDLSTIPPVLRDHFMTALMWCNRGDSGREFAYWLSATWPDAIIAMRSIGTEPGAPWQGKPPAEAILWIAQQIPVIWQQIASVPQGPEKLRQFITDVLSWTPDQAEQEGEALDPEVLQ